MNPTSSLSSMPTFHPLPADYPESFIVTKGIQGLDSGLWIDMIHRRSADVPGAIIKKIEHYKCTDGFEQEYLAAHIDHPLCMNDDRQVVLFVERTARFDFSTILGLSCLPFTSPVPASDTISISSPSVKDPIAFIDKEHQNHILISTIDFSQVDARPTDKDLSDVLEIAAARRPSFDIKHQGHWLARLACDALYDLFGGQQTSENVHKHGYFGALKLPQGDRWNELKSAFMCQRNGEKLVSLHVYDRIGTLG